MNVISDNRTIHMEIHTQTTNRCTYKTQIAK